MLPTRQSPEQLAEKIHCADGGGKYDSKYVAFIAELLTAHDAEVRAETLEMAARAIDADPIANGSRIIRALSPDPHYRERIELDARIAEAEWVRDHTGASSGYHSRYLDLHIKELKARLAALDAPKGEG